MFTDEENKAINASTLLAKKVEKLIKYQTTLKKRLEIVSFCTCMQEKFRNITIV